MRTTLVLDRERDIYTATLLKGRAPEITRVNALEQLKQIYDKAHPSKTIFMVGPEESIVELRSLPVEKESELASAIEFSMEESLPYPAERYNFAYSVIKKENGSSLVLLCATLKDVFEKELSPLKALGIAIHEARMAVAEALQWCSESIQDGDFIAVLYIKGSYILSMFSNRSPSYLKVSKNRTFILMELERLKKQRHLPLYWAGPEPVENCKEISFDITDLYKRLPKKGRTSLSYTLIDTTAEKFKKAFYIMLSLAVLVHLASSVVPYIRTKHEISFFQQKIKAYKKGSPAILKEISETEKKIGLLKELDTLVSEGTKTIVSLRAILEAIPDGVELERLRVQASKVELVGYAPDTIKVLNALKATGSFTNINSITTTSQKEGLERFIIKMESRADD